MFKYSILNPVVKSTPKDLYRKEFAEIFDSSIVNAPNYFDDIKVEKKYGSMEFIKTCARVDSVINPSTGYKYGDDYKTFVFSPNDVEMFVGRLIQWKDSYWININTNVLESCSNGGVFRRCNNCLRWIDEKGKLIVEPCIIDYNIMEAGDYAGRDATTIAGFEKLWCQRNERTIKIKSNQRFLFGNPENPVCYKLYGDGIRNFLNSKTFDNNSPSVLEFAMGGNYSNKETDDFENLVANAYKPVYALEINEESINQVVGFSTKLIATVTRNDQTQSDEEVVWISSNKKVCSVDDEGNIECVSLGDCEITAYLKDNPSVKSIVNVVVSEEIQEEYSVEVSAENYSYENCIVQGDTVVYKCEMYQNAVLQDIGFDFELVTEAKANNYEFKIIDGNHFQIKNKKRSSNDIKIICSNSFITYEHIVSLKGAW